MSSSTNIGTSLVGISATKTFMGYMNLSFKITLIVGCHLLSSIVDKAAIEEKAAGLLKAC